MIDRPTPPTVEFDTDFDTGLRFLQRWNATTTGLHYLACVTRPMPLHSLHDGVASPLAEQSAALRRGWPSVAPGSLAGFQRLSFAGGRVTLTLMTGQPEHCIAQCDARVNHFHVGSAIDPSRLARWLRRLAAPDARLTLATDVSGDALLHAGFVFCGPRQMRYAGLRRGCEEPASVPSFSALPSPAHAIVIGAGLAGAAVCERLAARGWRLTLLERHAAPAQEASGNLAGIMMPVLSRDENPTARLSRAAFLYAVQQGRRFGFGGAECGVLQLARDDRHAALQREIVARAGYPDRFVRCLTAAQGSALLDSTVTRGGWLFPQGGWANPAAVCAALLAACGDALTVRYRVDVRTLRRVADGWCVLDQHGNALAQASIVIFANGNGATELAELAGLPLQAVRGQVTHVAAADCRAPPLVVCGDGYVTPQSGAVCSIGASYDSHADRALQRASQEQNLARINTLLPDWIARAGELPLAGRVGFRCVAPDRLPLIGALPGPLPSQRVERLCDVPRWPGLYAALGYASRGLTWAPLAAELLAAQLCHEPLPIEKDLAAALDPARFRLKELRRRPPSSN